MDNRNILENMVNEFSLVMNKKEMLNKYKWFSLASGIRNEELTRKLLKEILSDLKGNI